MRSLLLLPALLCACGRFGFGVTSTSPPASDAGPVPPADARGTPDARDATASPADGRKPDAAPVSCATMREGAPCDDGNICTAESTCRGGLCTPAAPASDCQVADSRQEFSGQQGENGWWYGYWHAEVDPDGAYDPASDFIEMVYYPNGQSWRPPDYDPDDRSPGFSWCYLAPYWEHPGGSPWARKTPVRRWVSDVSGPAEIELHLRMVDTGGGDGVTKSLSVDGALVWSRHLDGTEEPPVAATIPVLLQQGTRVDFLLDAESNDSQDTTEFWVTIRSP